MARKTIDSATNPVVRSLKMLLDVKPRRTRRQFIVEGIRAVEEGLSAGYRPDICLYNPPLLHRTERGARLALALQRLPSIALYEATERALQVATDTIHSQGVIAAFPFIDAQVKRSASLPFFALICDDIHDPGNMGTLLRTAEAAGVQAVWTSPTSVDIYNPKVVRSAMGAHFRLPVFSEQPWLSIIASISENGISPDRFFCTSSDAPLHYDNVDWCQSSALVISNEAHGLTSEARQACLNGASISIPMLAETESLNAAIAGAVIMFEAARQRRQGAAHE